jgi:hypothetical protein
MSAVGAAWICDGLRPHFRGCLWIGLGLIVRVSLTSAAPATMPLPFTLPCRLGRSRLSLRLILLCHACTSRCVGNSCSLLYANLSGPGQAETGCNSCFPLVGGRRPLSTHSIGTFFQKITVWVELWFDLSNKLLVSSVPLSVDPANITLWASKYDAAEKTLLTLENCGEPGSLRSTGYSRSIGKTDNTQNNRRRASGIRNGHTRGKDSPYDERVRRRADSYVTPEKPKSHSAWLFGLQWPITGLPRVPNRVHLWEVKFRLRLVPLER